MSKPLTPSEMGRLGGVARWDGISDAKKRAHAQMMKAARKDAQGKKMRKSLKEQANKSVDKH